MQLPAEDLFKFMTRHQLQDADVVDAAVGQQEEGTTQLPCFHYSRLSYTWLSKRCAEVGSRRPTRTKPEAAVFFMGLRMSSFARDPGFRFGILSFHARSSTGHCQLRRRPGPEHQPGAHATGGFEARAYPQNWVIIISPTSHGLCLMVESKAARSLKCSEAARRVAKKPLRLPGEPSLTV